MNQPLVLILALAALAGEAFAQSASQTGPKAPTAASGPVFEIATIKAHNPDVPGFGIQIRGRRFIAVATSLSSLIAFAYRLHPRQILGAPNWVETEKYDIVAEAAGPEEAANSATMIRRVQALLDDRFVLSFHREKKTLSVYEIVVGKNGPKFLKNPGDPNANPGYGFRGLGMITATNAGITNLAVWLERYVLDRPVIDHTGISGVYNFDLNWKADEFQFSDIAGALPHSADEADRSDLYTAIQQQLGLKLESTKAATEVLLIDHVEKPSEN
jgi:uncharacterized protein (TIGR03435 family)